MSLPKMIAGAHFMPRFGVRDDPCTKTHAGMQSALRLEIDKALITTRVARYLTPTTPPKMRLELIGCHKP